MTDFAAARRAMVDSQLKPEGVSDPAIQAAMGSVAREEFVAASARDIAYMDRPVAGSEGRTMMPASALGKLLQQLSPRAGERAHVLAPASGYAAAVLEALGLTVTSGPTADVRGIDLLLVDGAVEVTPADIAAALSESGRAGLAIRENGVTRLAVARAANGRLAVNAFADADVPLVPGAERKPAFTF